MNSCLPWTAEETETLMRLWRRSSEDQIASELSNRTWYAIVAKAQQLKLKMGPPIGWERVSDARRRYGYRSPNFFKQILKRHDVQVYYPHSMKPGLKRRAYVRPGDVDAAMAKHANRRQSWHFAEGKDGKRVVVYECTGCGQDCDWSLRDEDGDPICPGCHAVPGPEAMAPQKRERRGGYEITNNKEELVRAIRLADGNFSSVARANKVRSPNTISQALKRLAPEEYELLKAERTRRSS